MVTVVQKHGARQILRLLVFAVFSQRLREALRPAANSRQFFTLARQCFNQNRRGASAYS